eukprot:677446-Rhodomonas_salina.1
MVFQVQVQVRSQPTWRASSLQIDPNDLRDGRAAHWNPSERLVTSESSRAARKQRVPKPNTKKPHLTTLLVQTVPGMRFLVFDFALYLGTPAYPLGWRLAEDRPMSALAIVTSKNTSAKAPGTTGKE